MSSRCAASALSAGIALAGPAARAQQLHGQRQDVVAPLAQRRERQRKDVEAVVEILAEAAGGDFLAQAAVGGREHAHIERDRRAAAEALDFALLQDAQQLRLQRQRHLGDFIEQQRAALRLLELAGMRGVRAGEGAALVAEQHGFEHVLGNRGAVDGDEGLRGARRAAMDEAREHFLAGAGLADDQHRAVAGRDAARELDADAASSAHTPPAPARRAGARLHRGVLADRAASDHCNLPLRGRTCAEGVVQKPCRARTAVKA